MLKPKKIDALACLLEEMTEPGINHPKLAWLETMVVGSVIAFFVLVSMLIGVKLWYPSKFDALLGIVRFLLAILLLVLLVAVFAGFFYTRRHRKKFAPYSKGYDLHRDAKFINELLKFDKATLTYGLLQYQRRWSSPERLIVAFIGDLRKLGLVPACLALFISLGSIATLSLFKGKEPFFLLLTEFSLAIVFLYVMAFFGFLSRERQQQVIQLLEYAIQHAHQYNATALDTDR